MRFSQEEQKKIKKLPFVLKLAVQTLTGMLSRVIDGDCDEDAVSDAIATLDSNSQSRYTDADLVTYDKAAKILGISVTNRLKLKAILDKYKIKQVTMHNQKVGFKRSDLMALRTKLHGEK